MNSSLALSYSSPHLPQLLDAALTKFRIKPQSQTWIQASMFRLYELLSTALFALDESDPRLLELLQAGAAPGHVLPLVLPLFFPVHFNTLHPIR